jgi:hypothetical protein
LHSSKFFILFNKFKFLLNKKKEAMLKIMN